MSVKLKITVTKEILEKSKYCGDGDSVLTNCAIALAVREIFPNASVGITTMTFDSLQGGEYVVLPTNARKFISAFDANDSIGRVNMAPISFEIIVPDKVINRINIDELKPLLHNHPSLEIIEV